MHQPQAPSGETREKDPHLDDLIATMYRSIDTNEIAPTQPSTEECNRILPFEDGTRREGLGKQFDALRARVNEFLDEQNGKKRVKRISLVKEPASVPAIPSWRNAYGLFWIFGIQKTDPILRVRQHIVEEQVERSADEGLLELQKIVDTYITTYEEYAQQIRRLCHNQLRAALAETTRMKLTYYSEVVDARKQALLQQGLKEKALASYQTQEKVYMGADPNTKEGIDAESTLDRLSLEIAQYTNGCILFAREATYKREHANVLKFVEYGLFLIYQTAENSARVVNEFIRQLQHLRKFSALSSETIRDLVHMDQKIAEGRPYILKSNELMMNLLGCVFGNYNGVPQNGGGDVSKVLAGIKQFHQRSQVQYTSAAALLDKMKSQAPYVNPAGEQMQVEGG